MPPQAIASPIPTTQAAPRPAASDTRTSSRSRTSDGGRAGDAPAQRNDRASGRSEPSSFDQALDRARKADEPAPAPVDARESREPTAEPGDAAAAETPTRVDSAEPSDAKGDGDASEASENGPDGGEVVVDDTETEESEAAATDERAQSAVAATATVETNQSAARAAIETSSERPTARGGETTNNAPQPEPEAQVPNGGARPSAQAGLSPGTQPTADDSDAAPNAPVTRGTGQVEAQEPSAQAPRSADEPAPDRAERAERAVRLSERIAPEGEEPTAPTNERPLNTDRVQRSANAQAFSDADAAAAVEERPVPENQPVRVERPVISSERPTTDRAQQPSPEGEGEAPASAPAATPGAVQAANAGARMSGEDDASRDRPNRSAQQKTGVERVEGAGRAAEPAPTNASTSSAAHEPRGVGETRAQAANAAQARPGPPAQDQATVLAANRGLDVALKQQGGSVQMRLAPESMGAMKVEMTISRGVVAATLQASTPEARDLLTRNIETLRSSLEAKGLSVERLSVTLAPASQGGSSGQSFNTNSGPQSQHQPAQGSGTQNSADHDAGGERSKGFFEHHERHRQDRQASQDNETDERLFKYRMGLHAIA